jgi:hypothetical protein
MGSLPDGPCPKTGVTGKIDGYFCDESSMDSGRGCQDLEIGVFQKGRMWAQQRSSGITQKKQRRVGITAGSSDTARMNRD